MRNFLFISGLALCLVQGIRADDAPTNVLFIAIDDLRTDLGCYGNEIVQSPNIDRLAKRGMVFQRAYCQQTVCNPSRASLLTGMRLNRLRIWDLPTHFRQRVPDVVTLPQMFKNNGYHAQCIGKIFHNWRQDDFKGDAISWSVPEQMHYNNHGSDKARMDGPIPPDLSDVPKCTVRDVPDASYFDGRVADLAVRALRELSNETFFLAVGFWKPHSPFNAPKKYWDLYDRSQITSPRDPDPPTDVPPIALHDSREILSSFRDRPGGRPTTDEAITLRHGYYANISYMDAQVGKVLDELDQLGLRDDTIIVLWSDHGFHLGEHSLWAKTSVFELDARVPLIVAAPPTILPARNHGASTDALVELLDIYPTLADWCGFDPPHDLAGRSLRPIVFDPATDGKQFALTQHPRPAYPDKGSDPEAMGYSLRTNRYRLTRWVDFDTGDLIATELYDHQVDPGETTNLAATHKGIIQSLLPLFAQVVDHGELNESTVERN